ncbi:MAG: hypothetical protein ACRDZW_05425 [Acidimicrobiales bacterium]
MKALSIAVDVQPHAVAPGSSIGRSVRIHNDSDDPVEVRFETLDTAGAWASTIPPTLTVGAHTDADAQLFLSPPTDAGLTPGVVPFQLRAVPIHDPNGAATANGSVEITGRAAVSAKLTPTTTGGRRSRFRLAVVNRGNVATTATVTASCPSRGTIVRARPAVVELGPAATADVEVTLLRRPSLGRRPAVHRLQVAVQPADDAVAPATVEVGVHEPARSGKGRVLALLGVVALVVAAVMVTTRGGDSTSPAGPAPPVDRYAVGLRTEGFVDAGRPTASHGQVPAQPNRPLPTIVLYPAVGAATAAPVEGAEPARSDGPFPLIVFAHGSSGGVVQRYGPLLRSWAAAGYVVAAPTFPFASNEADTSSDDYPNQPADVSFVTNELMRLNGDRTSPLSGTIDADRIGAAGSALGGITTLGLTQNACCRDGRFKAAAVFASFLAPFGDSEYFTEPGPPLLVVHGDRDETIPYRDARKAFTDAPGASFLVTIRGGNHADPYIGLIDRPQIRVTLAATLDFFDNFLRGDDKALGRLERQADDGTIARLERRG